MKRHLVGEILFEPGSPDSVPDAPRNLVIAPIVCRWEHRRGPAAMSTPNVGRWKLESSSTAPPPGGRACDRGSRWPSSSTGLMHAAEYVFANPELAHGAVTRGDSGGVQSRPRSLARRCSVDRLRRAPRARR